LLKKHKQEELKFLAAKIRLETVDVVYRLGAKRKAHPGPALSIADIITVLYFEVMRIDPARPDWDERDRFVLSKGHACPVLYVALSQRGYFSKKVLFTLRHINSMLQGHPDMTKTPGIDMTAGSLGHGLSLATGIALSAKKIDKKSYYVYVILGDGELQEGLVWEGAMAAGNFGLDNLVAFVDCNDWQSSKSIPVSKLMPVEPLRQKWEAFNWQVEEIDGHDISQIIGAVRHAQKKKSKPTVILAKTIKGKGVSFMENDNSWHQKSLSDEEMEIARMELMKGIVLQNG